MNLKELLYTVKEEEISFVGVVISTWHFDNLIACITHHQLSGGILVIRPQQVKGEAVYRLNKEYLERYGSLFKKIVYFDGEIKFHFRDMLAYMAGRKKQRPLYLIIPSVRPGIRVISSVLFLKRPLKHIIIDEGTSSYLSYSNFTFAKAEKQCKIKVYLNHSLYQLISGLTFRHIYNDVEGFTLFDRDPVTHTLTCNETVAQALEKIYIDKCGKREFTPCIFIFKDFTILDRQADLHLYRHLLDYLDGKGIPVYFKKHPNDRDGEFDRLIQGYRNVRLLPGHFSAEELIPRYNPMLLLGGYTTALFSTSNIFRTRAICFMNIYPDNYAIKEVNRDNIARFHRYFSGNSYLDFTRSIQETLEKTEEILTALK